MDMPPVQTPFYLDKALWLAVLTPLILIINAKFGTALDPAVVAGIVISVVTYILAHKWSATQKALSVYKMDPKAPTELNK